jgi:glycerophosphoryl diester phosphodiesterase
MFSLVLARLYSASAPAELRSGSDTGEGAGKPGLPPAVTIGAAVVSILAVVGLTLAVVSIARQNQPVMVIAHRGSSAEAPENTLAAFRLGADQGADFVELDVQESADGEVVVVHDSDLMKVGGSPLKPWGRRPRRCAGRHCATRAAVLRRAHSPHARRGVRVCKGRVRVVVELKSYSRPASRRARRRIVRPPAWRTTPSSMSLDRLIRRLKQLRPSWRVGARRQAIGDLTSLDADFLRSRPAGDAGLRRQAHRAGQDVFVWTVNDPAWMLAAMGHSVDGLITDRPDPRAGGRAARRDDDAQRIPGGALACCHGRADGALVAEAMQPCTLAAQAVLPAAYRHGARRQGRS